MSLPQIENLEIEKITEDIFLIRQIKTPYYFSCCNGLLILPKKNRNETTIAIDLNIEPEYIKAINNIYGPIDTYICSHGHMDHIAHVYAWEELGTIIYSPNLEAKTLTNLYEFYNCYEWEEMVEYPIIEKFGEINKYKACKNVRSFAPGDNLKFENIEIETIPFTGHSISHVGFFLPREEILHISCLGFDQLKPGIDGFGPWYGFKQCNISQYLDDINKAEIIFLEGAKFLTSSHSYVVKAPDKSPFEYMRRKIKENQLKVDKILINLKPTANFEEKIELLLKKDIFFPKKKMKDFLYKIYSFWEYWILVNHIKMSKVLKI